MKPRDAAEWEALARREPYFSLLTSDGACDTRSSRVPTPAYFQSGEEDVAALITTLTSLLPGELPLTSVLDFGCGAGRLTLPLARRARHVVATDIAPTMLEHVRRNATNAGLNNVSGLSSKELLLLPAASFDFICALLVFQHVEVRTGYVIFRQLLELLVPGGIAAVQVPLLPSRILLGRLLSSNNRRPRGRRRDLPSPMSRYTLQRLVHHAETAGARIIARLESDIGGTRGAVLVVEKNPALTPAR